MKLISIILPIFNMEQYLQRCLDSILTNTFTNYEIVCVNDGSTDGTLDILEQYALEFENIKIINKVNGGVASARNAGLAVSKGDYISFVDPDDWIHPQYLEYLYKAIEENHSDIAFCDYLHTNVFKEWENVQYTSKEISVEEMSSNHNMKSFVWRRLYRREVIEEIRFDENEKIEDSLYNLEVIVSNDQLNVVFVDLKLYAYFYREGSLVSTIDRFSILQQASRFIEYSKREKRDGIRAIIAEDAIKKGLSARHAFLITKDCVNSKIANDIICEGIKMLCQNKVKYRMLYYFPIVYRMWRLKDDKTMIIYEKNLKQELHNCN